MVLEMTVLNTNPLISSMWGLLWNDNNINAWQITANKLIMSNTRQFVRDSQFHSSAVEAAAEEQLSSQVVSATADLHSHTTDTQTQILKVSSHKLNKHKCLPFVFISYSDLQNWFIFNFFLY